MEAIEIPSLDLIASWDRPRLMLEQIRLRTEIGFIHGDRAHGGPDRDDFCGRLSIALSAINMKLEGMRGRS